MTKNLFLTLALTVITSCAVAKNKNEERTPAQTGSVGSVGLASADKCQQIVMELKKREVLCNLESTQLKEFMKSVKQPISKQDEAKIRDLQLSLIDCSSIATAVCLQQK